jgi:protein required for attachment to host cells
MKTTWVVVADEAIARILQRRQDGGDLEPVEEATDPDAHASGSDLRRDAAGRRSASAPAAGAQAHAPQRPRSATSVTASAGEGEQHLEAQAFARRVAQRLAEAFQQKRFDELRIVAAPRFLGLLRNSLDPQLADCVTQELDKDLVHLDNAEISRRLFPPGEGAAVSG